MANTPQPPKGQNVETMTYKVGKPGANAVPSGSRASYTPSAAINPFAYGKNGGKAAALGSVPEVQTGGSFEVGELPAAFDGNFGIGEDKNVSEIIGY